MPDRIIAGAATVRFQGRPVVPMGRAVTAQGSIFAVGSLDVMVGGPIVFGDVSRWTKVCEAMGSTRLPDQNHLKKMHDAGREARDRMKPPIPRPYRRGQSTSNNCGCEVARQIIWGYGLAEPTEEEVLLDAIDGGRAKRYDKESDKQHPDNWDVAGGTKAGGRQGIINDWGGASAPPTENVLPSQHDVVSALAEGHPVILPVLNWDGGKHVVLATGVEFDAQGRPVAIYVNDSDGAVGGCGVRIPLDSIRLDTTDTPTVVGRSASR